MFIGSKDYIICDSSGMLNYFYFRRLFKTPLRNKDIAIINHMQEEFINAVLSGDYSFVLFGGAIRGGKTVALLSLFTLLSKIYPGSRWVIIRKDIPTIKRNLYPSWEKIKPSNFIEKDASDSNQQTVTFTNGSQLIFFAENYDTDKDLNRWKGLEINGAGLEEINECQQQSLFKSFERAGSYVIPNSTNQPKPIVCATCNPSFGWVKDLIYTPYKENTLRENWLYIQSRIYDNIPLLTEQPDYLPSLKANLNRFQYEVFVEGNWDMQMKTGGEFYKCFEVNNHVGVTLYNPDLPLHISFDDNVSPYLPLGIFQIQGKNVYMIDEIAGVTPNNTVKSVCNEFIRKYPAHETGLFIYGDATAKKEDTKLEKGYNFYRLITDALSKYKPTLRVASSNPSVKMRGDFINTILEKEFNGIKVLIGTNCKKALNDFIAVKEAADGTKNKETATDPNTKKSYQIVGHFSDLFDYLICSAFANDFLQYQRGGTIKLPTLGKNISRNSY